MEKQKLKNFHIAHLFNQEDLPVGLRRPRRQLSSKVAKGYVSLSDIPDVTLLQPEPVAMVSGDVSQANSYSTRSVSLIVHLNPHNPLSSLLILLLLI